MLLGISVAAWTAIGTVAYALVAIFAAVFAGWQVWEIRRTREEEARPFVVVDVQPSPVSRKILNLVVENVGRTVARNVRLTFEPPLQSSGEPYPLAESPLIREGMPTMPPGRRVEALFEFAPASKNKDLPNPLRRHCEPGRRARPEARATAIRC
jgi:hypothetical protein